MDHKFSDAGTTWNDQVPREALPDCNACEKPELGIYNGQAVWLYAQIANQQMHNSFSGHVLGLRIEAVIAAIEWFTAAGRILDPDEAFDRVMLVDSIACRIRNDRIESEQKSKASK